LKITVDKVHIGVQCAQSWPPLPGGWIDAGDMSDVRGYGCRDIAAPASNIQPTHFGKIATNDPSTRR
jgi:hypothetical protein